MVNVDITMENHESPSLLGKSNDQRPFSIAKTPRLPGVHRLPLRLKTDSRKLRNVTMQKQGRNIHKPLAVSGNGRYEYDCP